MPHARTMTATTLESDRTGKGGPCLHRLIHVADVLRLHVRVLLAAAHKLGESSKQTLYPHPAHVHELAGNQSCSQRHICVRSGSRSKLERAQERSIPGEITTLLSPFPDFVTMDDARTTMVSSRVTKLCDRVACSAKGARSTGLSLSSGSLLHTSVRSHNRPKRSRHAPRLRSGTNSWRKLRNWMCLAFCKCAGAPAPPFWHLATMVQPKIRPCISQRTLAGPHFFVFFLSRLPLLCSRFNFTSHSTACFSYPIALRSCCESS